MPHNIPLGNTIHAAAMHKSYFNVQESAYYYIEHKCMLVGVLMPMSNAKRNYRNVAK